MRIAFIVGRFPALSETFILRQITGLLDRGHDVEIFAHAPGREPVTHEDVDKYSLLERTLYLNTYASSLNRIGRLAERIALLVANSYKNPRIVSKALSVNKFGKSALSLGVLHAIAPFLDKGPYDIMHCQFGPLGNLGFLLKDTGLLGGKLVTSFLGYDISSYPKRHGERVYDRLFSRGDLFLCVSEHMKAKLVRLGCDQRKIVVHRLGAEVKKSSLPLSRPMRNGKFTIVTIARLVNKKGVEYGIEAVAKILKKRPEMEYRIVGDGPLRNRLQGIIDELSAGENIKLVGWKDQAEVAELLKTSDILLAPSITTETGDEEGTPVVIMEAFARGLPVVSTYHAGIPEVVQDGKSGFLVPERDVEALAERLEKLIDDSELRFSMGRSGRAFIEEEYDINKLNDRLVTIYQQLLDGDVSHALRL
jgi:colanic acid/amylovoran biosynthesis glycosyltransferase